MCHVNGTGAFHLISVGAPAVPAHRAHGDGAIGQPVPGNPAYVFDAGCRPVAACTLSGDWVGDFLQPEYSPIPYTITFSSVPEAPAPSDVFAQVNYPDFAFCSGQWIVESVAGNTYTVVEYVGVGCISGTTFSVTFDSQACGLDGVGVSHPDYPDAIIQAWTFTASKP